MQILHISDIHIGPSDASNSRCINARETPRRMLTDPETVNVPDVVVAVSADADDDGSVEAYTAARRMVRESALRNRAAVAFCTGNHDERGTFAKVPGSGHRGAEGARARRTMARVPKGHPPAVGVLLDFRPHQPTRA
ncbi:metallophosphoesterase [Streptomyces sp. NPDC086776]|uniref:metallophosphoesterase n=1 Tax=Streptomyces sp. NPDC086776 TaxID=3365756 RepID=UPI000D1ABF90